MPLISSKPTTIDLQLMPRNETIHTVFVASPSDVSDERNILEEIIGEVNSLHARRTAVRLELLRWERDVSPAVGQDAQSIINKQIPQDYDVFVGIFWHRVGSPTSRAESGTLEEYSIAKDRYDEDPESIGIMLYFKDAPPLNMDNFDADQYKKVLDFRSNVGNEAVYKRFTSEDDFKNYIRIDLTKLVYENSSFQGAVDGALEEQEAAPPVDGFLTSNDDDENDDGYFELVDSYEDEMDSLNAVLYRMNDSVTAIGRELNKRIEDIQALNIPSDGRSLSKTEKQKFRAATKRVMKHTSKNMDTFVTRMKQDIPLFRRHLDKSVDLFTKAVPIHLELDEDEGKEGVKDTTCSLLRAMQDVLNSMEGFRDSVAKIPRMTNTLNHSKRETEKVLQEVIDITRSGYTSLEGVLSILP